MNRLAVFNEIPEFIWRFLIGAISSNDSILASIARRKLYRTSCAIDTNVFITNRVNFKAGYGSCIYHSCYILNTHGKFTIGNHSHLGAMCYVNVCYGNLEIGDYVAIGPGTKMIVYSNHYESGKKVTEVTIIGNVVIGNNVFIGANCTILPGTIVHDNVVIGAGSVVKGEIEGNSVYAGVPCKKIQSGWYE